MNRRKELFVFIFLIMALLVYFKITSNSYIDEVKENGVQTVGKVVKFTGISRKPALYFIFYPNGKYQKASSFRDDNNVKIGMFYKVYYLKDNPEKYLIELDKPISDTTLILKAGFSIEDISK
jgi:hypothetical protein